MKYRPEIGKIYDSLFFHIKYFNAKMIKEAIAKQYFDPSFMEECYHRIEKTVPVPPQILKFVFLNQDQTPTVMTKFFAKHIDYQHDTIESFLQKIAENSNIIFSDTLALLFPDESFPAQSTNGVLTAPDTYMTALKDSFYSEETKLEISLFFGNFNHIITLLTEQILKTYYAVDDLHRAHRKRLMAECEHICFEENQVLYQKLLSLGFTKLEEDTSFSVSLLHQYIIQESMFHDHVGLLLGFAHEDAINQHLVEQNIDIQRVLIAVGNSPRLNILNALFEYGELSAASIVKITKIPATTVLRHVGVLYDSDIIYIARRTGRDIIYRVNYSLLTHTVNSLNRKIGESAHEQSKRIAAKNMG